MKQKIEYYVIKDTPITESLKKIEVSTSVFNKSDKLFEEWQSNFKKALESGDIRCSKAICEAMFANGYKESLKEDAENEKVMAYLKDVCKLTQAVVDGEKVYKLYDGNNNLIKSSKNYRDMYREYVEITLPHRPKGVHLEISSNLESLKESADDTKALIDFLKSLKLDDEVEEKDIGDWTVNAWTTEPRLNFSRGFYIVQIDNDKLNKHFSISDCMSQKDFEYERDRVIKDKLGKSLKEAKNDTYESDDEIIVYEISGQEIERFVEIDEFDNYNDKEIVDELVDRYGKDITIKRVSYDEENTPCGYETLYDSDYEYDDLDEALDTDFDNKKVRRDIIGWWDAVERWNDEHDRPYNIDNGDKEHATAQEVEEMLAAMFDMLIALRDEQKDSDEARDLLKKGKRIYNKYDGLSQFNESKKLKESKEDIDVDAWVLDKIAYMNAPLATVEYGFDSSSWEDDMETRLVGGDTKPLELVVAKWDNPDHPNRMIKLKSYPIKNGMTMRELEAQLKGNKEPVKESIEEAKDGKFYAYMILDDKFDELDTPVDSEFEEKGLHTVDDIKEYVKKTYPNAKRIVKTCYTFDNKQMKECEDEFEIINLDDAKVEEKKETAKDRVLAKKAKLKERYWDSDFDRSEPEEKPEFLHKGDWVWDDVACDWYDNNSGDYHLELVHNSELPLGDSDEDIQAVFGLKESADWTSDEILAIVDKLNAEGIATTTNKGIADAYAANENPYRRFEVSKADDKDEWTIKVVWKDDTFESDDTVEESLENIPTITDLFGNYDN